MAKLKLDRGRKAERRMLASRRKGYRSNSEAIAIIRKAKGQKPEEELSSCTELFRCPLCNGAMKRYVK